MGNVSGGLGILDWAPSDWQEKIVRGGCSRRAIGNLAEDLAPWRILPVRCHHHSCLEKIALKVKTAASPFAACYTNIASNYQRVESTLARFWVVLWTFFCGNTSGNTPKSLYTPLIKQLWRKTCKKTCIKDACSTADIFNVCFYLFINQLWAIMSKHICTLQPPMINVYGRHILPGGYKFHLCATWDFDGILWNAALCRQSRRPVADVTADPSHRWGCSSGFQASSSLPSLLWFSSSSSSSPASTSHC